MQTLCFNVVFIIITIIDKINQEYEKKTKILGDRNTQFSEINK